MKSIFAVVGFIAVLALVLGWVGPNQLRSMWDRVGPSGVDTQQVSDQDGYQNQEQYPVQNQQIAEGYPQDQPQYGQEVALDGYRGATPGFQMERGRRVSSSFEFDSRSEPRVERVFVQPVYRNVYNPRFNRYQRIIVRQGFWRTGHSSSREKHVAFDFASVVGAFAQR